MLLIKDVRVAAPVRPPCRCCFRFDCGQVRRCLSGRSRCLGSAGRSASGRRFALGEFDLESNPAAAGLSKWADGPFSGSRLKEVPMLEYRVNARRLDADGSVASCKDATVSFDTDVNGRQDAFNPAEAFLAASSRLHDQGNRTRNAGAQFRSSWCRSSPAWHPSGQPTENDVNRLRANRRYR